MPPNNICKALSSLFPQIRLVACENFRWSPTETTVYYIPQALEDPRGSLLLVHEIGHATLEHSEIRNDIDLLRKEVQAWQKAQEIASQLDMKFDDELAEDCLDTYRLWVDKRSSCPECDHTGYQDYELDYRCFNCNHQWQVSLDQTRRVCRVSKTKTPR